MTGRYQIATVPLGRVGRPSAHGGWYFVRDVMRNSAQRISIFFATAEEAERCRSVLVADDQRPANDL